MLGPVEELLGRSGPGAAGREELRLVRRSGLRLLKLVNTLLDFARIEAGRVQACYEPLDLAALTADLTSVFRSAIEKAGLRLSVDCQPLSAPVLVDRDMWEKIALNLLSNALKFTLGGEIAVTLGESEARVELSVRDTGIGIREKDVGHVFSVSIASKTDTAKRSRAPGLAWPWFRNW